jgi:hypothetical protein
MEVLAGGPHATDFVIIQGPLGRHPVGVYGAGRRPEADSGARLKAFGRSAA